MTSLAESGQRRAGRGRLAWIALALSLTLNLFFLGGLAWSKFFAEPFGLTPAERFQQLGRDLNLNDDQRAAFRQFFHTVRLRGQLLRESNEPLMERVWAELAKPQPDDALISRLVEQAAENRHDFQKTTAAALGTFMATLTPEQRAQFANLAKQHQDIAAKRLWRMIIP